MRPRLSTTIEVPQHIQIAIFRTHIAAARAKAVCRSSSIPETPTTRWRRSSKPSTRHGPLTGVLHCFSFRPGAGARRRCRLGFYISFSGILTFKKSEGLREIAAALPAESLLIETDAPYLAPVPMRGRRNEPSFVAHTLAALAAAAARMKARLPKRLPPISFDCSAKLVAGTAGAS